MNGVHDMGGQQGMGPVEHEKNEPVFHAAWEGRVYALTRAMRAWRKWSLDTDRHALELLPPVDYLRMSYYERWVHRLAAQVVQYGLVTKEEMESGTAGAGLNEGHSGVQLSRRLPAGSAGESLRAEDPKRSTVVQGGPARARPQHQSHRPHAPAAVRARQDRRHRPGSRCLSLSRHQRPFSGRETPARLLRTFRRAGVVGGGRVAAGLGAPRPVG